MRGARHEQHRAAHVRRQPGLQQLGHLQHDPWGEPVIAAGSSKVCVAPAMNSTEPHMYAVSQGTCTMAQGVSQTRFRVQKLLMLLAIGPEKPHMYAVSLAPTNGAARLLADERGVDAPAAAGPGRVRARDGQHEADGAARGVRQRLQLAGMLNF